MSASTSSFVLARHRNDLSWRPPRPERGMSGSQEDGRDHLHETFELPGLRAQSAAPRVGEPIELRLAAGVARPPLGLEESVALHAVEGGIERAILDAERIFAALAQPRRYRVAVARPERQRFQD